MHGLRFLFHYLFIPFIIVSVSAQSQSDQTFISMDEAIARALKQNNQVRASEYAVKQANWNKKNAWTLLFPRITLIPDIFPNSSIFIVAIALILG